MTYVFVRNPCRKAAMLARLRKKPLTSTVRFVLNGSAASNGLYMNKHDFFLHANKFACRMAMSDRRPVIFLEDDCEFCTGMTFAWAKAAEGRIRNIDAITFGALMAVSVLVNRDWIRVFRGCALRGMILSPAGMVKMLGLPYTGAAHDTLFCARAVVNAPQWPVALQMQYQPQRLSAREKSVVVPFSSSFRCSLNLSLIYKWSHAVGVIGGVYVILSMFVLLVALISIVFIY